MLNKKLVLGSLAGATLLVGAAIMVPGNAEAAVQGTCVNCHTMHNSQDGTIVITGTTYGDPANGFLLNQDCIGCHAGANNDATGRDAATPFAPQVGPAASGNQNAGGYFSTTVGTSHTVSGDFTGMAADLTTAPGGTFTGVFDCVDCHGAGAAHHSTPTSYRMLESDTNNDGTPDGATVTQSTPDANFGNAGSGTQSEYDAATMNAFCGSCHGDFHGTTNTGASSPFVRHPTNVAAKTYGANYNYTIADLPVGDNTATRNVMCISCHKAHGNANLDMIRFNYGANVAGDGTALTQGCESCHGAK